MSRLRAWFARWVNSHDTPDPMPAQEVRDRIRAALCPWSFACVRDYWPDGVICLYHHRYHRNEESNR